MVFRECAIISYYDATVPTFWLELCAEDNGHFMLLASMSSNNSRVYSEDTWVSRNSSQINSLIFWYAMLSFFNSASSVSIHNYAMVLIAVRLRMQASDICGLEFKKHPLGEVPLFKFCTIFESCLWQYLRKHSVVDKTVEIHVELLLL